jgi:hypothetical protein
MEKLEDVEMFRRVKILIKQPFWRCKLGTNAAELPERATFSRAAVSWTDYLTKRTKLLDEPVEYSR